MKKNLVVFGAGGLGREVVSMLKALHQWEVKGFYDDGKAIGELIGGIPVLGSINELLSVEENIAVVIAIGNPAIKMKVAERLSANSFLTFPTLIHPNAIIQDSASVTFGEGSIIAAGAILTTGIYIGRHVLLNLNCTVGHDVDVGDYSSIMPGANIAGEVKIRSGVMIGSGANVLNGLRIGDLARVGAGAVVTKDVSASDTVVGVPAHQIKNIDS